MVDRRALHAHMTRDRVQARAVTTRAFLRFVFIDPLRLAFGRKFIFQNRIAVVFFARLQILVPNFAKPAAFLARAVGRIEREQTRIELLERAATTGTTHLGAHDGEVIFRVEQMCGAAADLERALREIARFQNSFRVDHADDDVDGVFFKAFEFSKVRNRNQRSIDIECVETLPFRPARDIGVKTFARFDKRRENLERTAFRRRLNLFHNRSQALLFDRQIAVRTKLRAGFCEQEPQEMINLRDGRDRRFAAAARDALLDGHARRQTLDKIDIGFFELLDKLPRVGRHAVEKAALAFRKEDVERERRFPRSRSDR